MFALARFIASTIVTEKAINLARANIEGYILECNHRTKILADRLEFDEGLLHHRLLMARLRT